MPTPHLTFLGAADSVTGSCTLVEYKNTRILIDYGTVQGQDPTKVNRDLSHLSPIHGIIMTHGHLDHTGEIPSLVQEGYTGPIFGQYATCEIARIIWQDSARLGGNCPLTHYDSSAVKEAEKKLLYLEYGVPFSVGDISLKFFDAGHILGSSHVQLEAGDRRILFSGDVGPVNTPIIRDPRTDWKDIFDTVVIESTYGDRMHRDRANTINQFGQLVKRVIAQNGVLLIPAFAIGRTQEILFHLNTLVESGTIAPIPVFVDSPMASDVTSIYRRYRQNYDEQTRELIASGDQPLQFKGLTITDSYSQSESISRMRPPFIVIAGSGMCNGGRIVRHLKTFLPLASTTVMIVGYQARGTLGRALVEKATKVTIDGEAVEVRATVETLGGFSAHADQAGLISWARAIPGGEKEWIVNHGEEKASHSLASEIERLGLGEAVVAREGRIYK